jgi:acyl carrier protein
MVSVEEMIRKYVAEDILFSSDGYPYSDDASFLGEGILNSMNILELVMFVEEKFHLKLPDQDIIPENFDSIGKLSAYIRSKAQVAV